MWQINRSSAFCETLLPRNYNWRKIILVILSTMFYPRIHNGFRKHLKQKNICKILWYIWVLTSLSDTIVDSEPVDWLGAYIRCNYSLDNNKWLTSYNPIVSETKGVSKTALFWKTLTVCFWVHLIRIYCSEVTNILKKKISPLDTVWFLLQLTRFNLKWCRIFVGIARHTNY